MYKRLYVIGNGFDLHYGIKSSYMDFCGFLNESSASFHVLLEEVSHIDLWSDFEAALGALSADCLKGDIYGFMGQVSDESDEPYQEMLASYDYQVEAAQKDLNFKQIMKYFERWVDYIDISSVYDDGLVWDDSETLYFTFNYTRTLEDVFHVKPGRILHIHGIAGEPGLVVGHQPMDYRHPDYEDGVPEFYQIEVLENLRINFVEQTEKPVGKLIDEHQLFFRGLADIEEVHVVGFGFGGVDLPYLSEIKSWVTSDCKWYVYQQVVNRPYAEFPVVGKARILAYPSGSSLNTMD